MKKDESKKVETEETKPETVKGEVVEETKEEEPEKKGIPGWAKLLGGVGLGVALGAIVGGLFHREPDFEDYDFEDSDDSEDGEADDSDETGGESEDN